jgi:hypothetical protein
MWLRLLTTVSFLGLIAAYLSTLFLCWSVPRLLIGRTEDNFWGLITRVDVPQVVLLSMPTLIVGLVSWLVAWLLLLRDSLDERTAPAPQAYLAFFTISGVIFTILISWRELHIFGELSTAPDMEKAKEIIAGLIGGALAFLISIIVLVYHGNLWRRYRRYFQQAKRG